MSETVPETWFLLRQPELAAAENMATDEALLLQANELAHPVLRFYGWAQPAATFGYFQRYSEVAALTALRPLVRRPTGGGIVPHDADWTYSLVFPAGHYWHGLAAVESYQRVHLWIQRAFAELNLKTALAEAPRQAPTGQCFIGAEQFDVLLNTRKIAGGAQRRNRNGLLIQGSIQPPPGQERSKFEKAFCEYGSAERGIKWVPLKLSDGLRKQVHALAQSKYSKAEYNEKR